MPLPSPPTGIADLLDRAAIADVIYAYAQGLDRRDWVLYRSIFDDAVDFDFFTWEEGDRGLFEKAAALGARARVDVGMQGAKSSQSLRRVRLVAPQSHHCLLTSHGCCL